VAATPGVTLRRTDGERPGRAQEPESADGNEILPFIAVWSPVAVQGIPVTVFGLSTSMF